MSKITNTVNPSMESTGCRSFMSFDRLARLLSITETQGRDIYALHVSDSGIEIEYARKGVS